MSNNNHNHIGCGDEELFVSYLYDEIDAAGRSRFENHLRACASCAEELAALRDVQFSVADWKRTEFSDLSAPFVELPVEARKPVEGREVAVARPAFGERLRALFAFRPSILAAGTAFVLLFFAATVFLVLSGAGNETQIAGGSDRPDATPTASATRPAIAKEASPPAASPARPSADDSAPKVEASAARKAIGDAQDKKALQPEKVKASPPRKKPSASDKKKEARPPALSPFDDEEDESLRLADLFAEIDTDE